MRQQERIIPGQVLKVGRKRIGCGVEVVLEGKVVEDVRCCYTGWDIAIDQGVKDGFKSFILIVRDYGLAQLCISIGGDMKKMALGMAPLLVFLDSEQRTSISPVTTISARNTGDSQFDEINGRKTS